MQHPNSILAQHPGTPPVQELVSQLLSAVFAKRVHILCTVLRLLVAQQAQSGVNGASQSAMLFALLLLLLRCGLRVKLATVLIATALTQFPVQRETFMARLSYRLEVLNSQSHP